MMWINANKMKNKILIWLTGFLLCLGCKKNDIGTSLLSTLNVINATVDAGQAKVNYFGKTISWKNYTSGTAAVNYGAVQLYAVTPGNNIHIVQSSDTTKSLFNGEVTENDRDIYSLYLTGTLAAPESIVKKENLPPFYSDMSIGVRVINLSPNSDPVNVTLESIPTVNEFTGVGYKSITEFKKLPYPAMLVTGSNVFQLRDAAGTLLASYTLPTEGLLSVTSARYRNITLVIKGLQGTTTGTNAFGAFAVANF